MTWYPQEFADRVPMTDMAMRADPRRNHPGRSYRFYKGPVVYPFGHGLTYTSFSYYIVEAPKEVSVPVEGRREGNFSAAVRVSRMRCGNLKMELHVDVENKGERDGAETVMVFASPPKGHVAAATRQLVAFEKIHVAARSRAPVRLDVDVCKHLSFADASGIRRIPIGEHTLHVGGQKHSFSLLAAVPGL